MNGEGRSGPRAANVEALLEEAPWLRRLARGLLGDETAAEDLSQDVLAAALRERVELSGFRLRAWLRTVARRIAGRSRSREQLRRTVEEHAARSEVERDASERLDVHRRLAAAIERLPPTYRTALVLRYFEELEPREIAERLGIPAPTVRKRLSRGLALLRAELDRDYGGRKAWALALGACLRGSQAPRPTPSAPIGAGGITVIAMSTFKLALLGILPVAALGLWWLGNTGHREAVLPVSPSVRTESIASPTSPVGHRAEDAGVSARRVVESPVEASVAATAVVAPRLRVVDSAGNPVAGARAAAIDPHGFVLEIVLDDAASAELSDDLLGSRFVASAPGYGPALSEPSTADGLEVALAPMRIVRGILLEDGEPPEQPLELICWYPAPAWVAVPNAQKIKYELSDLEILEDGQRFRTQEGGSFRFQCPQEVTTTALHIPPSHVVMAVDGVPATGELVDRLARVKIDAGELRVETARLPFLSGRLVRADDGAPVVTDVTWSLEDRGERNCPMINMAADQDGSFRIGLPLDEEDLLLPPSERAAQVTAHTAHLFVSGREFRSLQLEIDLEGIEFPYDLGTIELEKAMSVGLRVVDRAGTGIEGALVWTSKGSVCTDRDGLARIEFEPAAELLVLATGYSLGKLALETEPADPIELSLEPGLALAVLAQGKDGQRIDSGVRVKLAWNRTPFQGARPGEKPFPDAQHAFEKLHTRGLQSHSGGWNDLAPGMPGYRFLKLPAEGPLVIPCLEMGGEVLVSLVDAFERPLVERTVRLQAEPGVQRIELEAPELHHFRVHVTANGQDVATGNVRAVPTGAERGNYFAIRAGEAHVGPTTAGTYDLEIQVQGRPSYRIEACELAPSAPPLVIELHP